MRKRNLGWWATRLAGTALLVAVAVMMASAVLFAASDYEWL
jgi:hypothetical protein